MSKIQKKPAAHKKGHPTLQNMNFKKNFYFCGSFLPSWIRIRIRIPNPYPQTRLNPDPLPWLEVCTHYRISFRRWSWCTRKSRRDPSTRRHLLTCSHATLLSALYCQPVPKTVAARAHHCSCRPITSCVHAVWRARALHHLCTTCMTGRSVFLDISELGGTGALKVDSYEKGGGSGRRK
jgi:hypothetical protein